MAQQKTMKQQQQNLLTALQWITADTTWELNAFFWLKSRPRCFSVIRTTKMIN